MAEDTTKTETDKKSKAAKEVPTSRVGFPFPQLSMPNLEVPNIFGSAAAQWAGQSKDDIEKAIAAVEEMNSVRAEVWSTATKFTDDCTTKMTEVMRNSAVAAFDLVHGMMAAKSLSEVIEIPTVHARKQFDALAAQNLELWSLVQEAAVETIRPITAAMPKVFQTPTSS
jgi:hypothetical protein